MRSHHLCILPTVLRMHGTCPLAVWRVGGQWCLLSQALLLRQWLLEQLPQGLGLRGHLGGSRLVREQVSLLLHGLIEIAIQFGEGVVGDDGLRLLVRFVLECLLLGVAPW